MIRKYRYLLTAAAAVGAAGLLTFAARNDFGLGRNMEIAVNMMRELSLNYVDPVDPDRLMEGAAAGMVSTTGWPAVRPARASAMAKEPEAASMMG